MAQELLPKTYNGGGSAYNITDGNVVAYKCQGAGATHIATESGLLKTFENKIDKLIMVSAGGGGAIYYPAQNLWAAGGSGGGGAARRTSRHGG